MHQNKGGTCIPLDKLEDSSFNLAADYGPSVRPKLIIWLPVTSSNVNQSGERLNGQLSCGTFGGSIAQLVGRSVQRAVSRSIRLLVGHCSWSPSRTCLLMGRLVSWSVGRWIPQVARHKCAVRQVTSPAPPPRPHAAAPVACIWYWGHRNHWHLMICTTFLAFQHEIARFGVPYDHTYHSRLTRQGGRATGETTICSTGVGFGQE